MSAVEPKREKSVVPQGTKAAEAPGANAVMWISFIGFSILFAAWLMFGILGKPIQKEFNLSLDQLAWVLATATLSGSLFRLPAGIITDRIGGRKIMTLQLLTSAVFSLMIAFVPTGNYPMLLLGAFLVGLAGNSFTVGIAWNSAWFSSARQGFALGLFGAGNVGASVTKFIGPPIIGATAGATYFGVLQGGWRVIPVIYAALLLISAALTWFFTPSDDRCPGKGRDIKELMAPLKYIQVWRFSLYYVVVFGAYVALSGWLPTYYVDTFGISLTTAGLLTATFIFPASLLRPLGGSLADKYGARKAMYYTFAAMIASLVVLTIPFHIPLVMFAATVFILGCAMGIGKAAVYKHIPTYFPKDVGAVGGLVGMLGGLGGFFLPPLFAWAQRSFGHHEATFGVLLALVIISATWMQLAIIKIERAKTAG